MNREIKMECGAGVYASPNMLNKFYQLLVKKRIIYHS